MARNTGEAPVPHVAASAGALSLACLVGAAVVASFREDQHSARAESPLNALQLPALFPHHLPTENDSPPGFLAATGAATGVGTDGDGEVDLTGKADPASVSRKRSPLALEVGLKAVGVELPFSLAPSVTLPQESSVIMVGGGVIPDSILSLVALRCAAAGALQNGGDGSLLICSYATEEPEEGFRRALVNFGRVGAGNVKFMPLPDDPEFSLEEWRSLVGSASGIFFTGGDQKRLYSRLQGFNLLPELHARVERGPAVLGGTSAGTAVMSPAMIAGGSEVDPVNWPGLPLVKSGSVTLSPGFSIVPFITDQHFSQRGRLPRLASTVRTLGQDGIGVDEQTAVVFSQGRYLEVVGNGQATVVSPSHAEDLYLATLSPGSRFDLFTRTLIQE